MTASRPARQTRLRTRVTAYFLFAATPAVLLSTTGVIALDGLLEQEITARQQETVKEAQRIVEAERQRVATTLDRIVEDDRLSALAVPEDDREREEFEQLVGRLTAAYGLDLLAIGALAGAFSGELLCNAHLPAASSDETPAYVQDLVRRQDTAVGLVHERVDGNPPALVPALVTARVVRRGGKAAFVLYGGARLDGHRLTHVAQAGQATLVLRSPGLRPLVFGREPSKPTPLSVVIEALPQGRSAVDPGTVSAPETPTVLDIYVHTERLKSTRALIRNGAAALGLAALLTAVLAGAFLSRRLTRPIVELSDAARRIGAGDLEVQLAPRSNDEVGTLVRVFNRMGEELAQNRVHLARAERVAAWQQIARRVAHEIKNPLFPIQMSIETLQKSYLKRHPKLDEIVEESTRTVLAEVRALNRIVTEFSDFARLPTPKQAPEDPQDILRHVVNLYRHSDEQRATVELLEPQDPDLPPVQVDKDQISRALINLVKNAQEATPAGGHIRLSARLQTLRGEPGVCLQVEDDGPGMSEAVQQSLFTPYFTTKAEGTGLGLAIVDRIVSEHGGQVVVDSEVGRGTALRLWLPLGPAL